MKLYRAVPKAGFDANATHVAKTTRRTPRNVPFLVDNIWEWLRPDDAPSRRHAIYASPNPLIALSSASSLGANVDQYLVCELDLDCDLNQVRLAHLNVTDARLHGDIGKLMQFMAELYAYDDKDGHHDFADRSLEMKLEYAPLYLPVVTKAELEDYFGSSTLARSLRALSTFWQDTKDTPQEHQGELFFELPAGASYRLKPVGSV